MAGLNRGQLQVVSDIKRQGEAGADTGVSRVSFGGDKAFGELAAGFSQIGARIGKMADAAAVSEGDEEGREAGLDSEFRTRRDGTLRGGAYDAAGLNVAETRLKLAMAETLEEAWTKHKGSPAALAKAIDGAATGFLNGAPDELRPKLQLQLGAQRLTYMRQAQRELDARVRAEQSAALQNDLMLSMRTVQQQAFALGLDAEADTAMAMQMRSLGGLLDRKGPDGQPLVKPAERARLLSGVEQEVSKARIYGAFERLPTAEAKAHFLQGLESDFKGSTGLAKVFDLSEYRQIRSHLETDLKRTLSQDNLQHRGVLKLIESITNRAEKGVLPTPEEMSTARAAAATSRDPNVSLMLQDAEGELARMREFRSLPLDQMGDTVQALRRREEAEGASEREVKRREMAERLYSRAQQELKSNPLGWDDKVGMIKLVPLDTSSSEQLAASGRMRALQAEEVAARHKLAKPVYLQPHEARSLASAFAKGGAEGLEMVEAVTTAFGDKAGAVLEQVGKHGPTVAHLGKLWLDSGKTQGVLDAAEGQHLVSIPGYKRLAPERSKTREIVMSEAGGALAGFEEAMSTAANVADLIYEKRALAARVTGFDDRLWRKAFREALGQNEQGGVSYGGVVDQGWWSKNPILLPGWVRRDRWQDALTMIEPADLAAAGLGTPTGRDDKPISMTRIRAGRLIQTGDGEFAVSLSGGSKPDVARDGKPGQPFVIDLKALRQRLTLRRPDLFLGGE